MRTRLTGVFDLEAGPRVAAWRRIAVSQGRTSAHRGVRAPPALVCSISGARIVSLQSGAPVPPTNGSPLTLWPCRISSCAASTQPRT
jgi:hypothetical protein